jgi:hypothetical protein
MASHQVNSVKLLPVSGAQRKDTIYDDIMAHYQAQISPGTFNRSYLLVSIKEPQIFFTSQYDRHTASRSRK